MAGQHTYVADRILLTVPPPLLSKIQFIPQLPLARRALNERMPMGGTIKCMVAYDTPFWKDRGYSGEVVADGDPLTVVFDNTTEEGIPILLGFIVGQPARLWGTDHSKRRATVMNALVRYFGPDAHQSIECRGRQGPSVHLDTTLRFQRLACGQYAELNSESPSVEFIGQVRRQPRRGWGLWKALCSLLNEQHRTSWRR